ncbi:hypothetical protein AVEN_274796-1 [Araneus ventricosus]|uniref:Uncharacterized protein n=1 Tax=Araneus ventricosus TaxID=182803 RepID=A0A4Y2N130_ARAVE|nr:hypothetical protein AVEN_274796-1 [Araneus ventricosus]
MLEAILITFMESERIVVVRGFSGCLELSGDMPVNAHASKQDCRRTKTSVQILRAVVDFLYASPGPANAAIELLMTGNKLPGLTSLVSNCIGWMDVYWYGDNLMNPWTQHVNRELFNLVEPLWWYGAFAVGLICDL